MPWFNQGLWCGVGKHHFRWGTLQVEVSNSVPVPPLHLGQVVQVPTWCSFSHSSDDVHAVTNAGII
jgi:hypothetical protein